MSLWSAVGAFTDKIPLQVNITLHSMLIIMIGSFKSMEEMIRQIKRIHVDGKGGDQNIERMSTNDAITMPIFAGITLTSLYFAMEYFGKEATNYFILAYIGICGGSGVKALLFTLTGDALEPLDRDFVVDFTIGNPASIGLELQLTKLDFPCIVISCVQMLVYAFVKSMLYNNFLALLFCLHAL